MSQNGLFIHRNVNAFVAFALSPRLLPVGGAVAAATEEGIAERRKNQGRPCGCPWFVFLMYTLSPRARRSSG